MFPKFFINFWFLSISKCQETYSTVWKKYIMVISFNGFVFNNLTFRILKIFW